MDRELYQRMQLDLAKAIKENNVDKVAQLRKILNISDEQIKYFNQGLTGYPSVDKVWLKYYEPGAEERANNIPLDKTVWDVIEEKILEYYDIPALEYFGNLFSRLDFRELCYTWARTFRAMGVSENEVVPVYGPFVPDICAMVFGLNMIGACPYFLKLAISPEALEEETRDAKIAVVFDGMWGLVAEEFSKPKFKNVIVASAATDMPSPKKEIVSFISKMQAIKNKSRIPDEKKYIWTDKARDIANYYSGDVKVPFVPNRNAFTTSSSGTTVGGVVKGTVATNETTISQLFMGKASGTQFFPGDRCLDHFPPTAATSLNLLFLTALYCGETVILDPRVSEKDFYNQLINLRPNAACSTGSAWEAFFNRVELEMARGKKFDFSYAKGWTVGGEGTDVKKFRKWNEILDIAHAQSHMFIGYGLSELFSAASASKLNAEFDYKKSIMSVGIPYAGIVMGVFDKEGKELSYNQRGELWIKSKSAMKEYYNKPELTNEVKKDGWIHTGDLAEIDENGFIYVWGRIKEKVKSTDGREVYLFDIANKIKENPFIDDAIILCMPTKDNDNNLVAHIVWDKNVLDENKQQYFELLNTQLMEYLPSDIEVSGYSVHETMLPYSPTTLKKDKNKMSQETLGYVQIIDGKLKDVDFVMDEDGKYIRKESFLVRRHKRR